MVSAEEKARRKLAIKKEEQRREEREELRFKQDALKGYLKSGTRLGNTGRSLGGGKRPLTQLAASERKIAAENKQTFVNETETKDVQVNQSKQEGDTSVSKNKSVFNVFKKNVGKGSNENYFPTFKKVGVGALAAGGVAVGAGKAFGRAGVGAAKAVKEKIAPTMFGYAFLLLLSIGTFFFRSYFGADGVNLLVSSLIQAFFFLTIIILVEHNLSQAVLVLIAVCIDLLIIFGVLNSLPSFLSGLDGLIAGIVFVQVYMWVILAFVFLIWGFSIKGSWQKADWLSKGVLITALGIIIIIVFNLIVGSNLIVDYKTLAYDQAKIKVNEQVSEFKETVAQAKNTGGDYIACIGDTVNVANKKYPDMKSCLNEQKYLRYCQDKFEFEDDIQDCVDEQMGRKRDAVGSRIASVSKRKPITFNFQPADYFPYELNYEDEHEYTYIFKYENPYLKEFEVQFSCSFDGISYTEDALGEIKINNENANSYSIKDEKNLIYVTCAAKNKLKGEYNIIYNATLVGLEGESDLVRYFIGPVDAITKEKLTPIIESKECVGAEATCSQLSDLAFSNSPNDPAAIAFGFGNTAMDPLISSKLPLTLGLKFVNNGEGRILKINSYNIDLPGFVPPSCLHGENILVSSKSNTKEFKRPGCPITDYPSELKDPSQSTDSQFSLSFEETDVIPRTFTATFNYNYLISKKTLQKVVVFEPQVIG